MEAISTFDIFKIGVGPSSSHTMGPWRAAQRFLARCRELGFFDRVARLRIELYGSLAKTGRGHGTDLAILMGLSGEDPVTCDTTQLHARVAAIQAQERISLEGTHEIPFRQSEDLVFQPQITPPFHSNGLSFKAYLNDGTTHSETYYSIGGGFVVQENEAIEGHRAVRLPLPTETAADLLEHCAREKLTIPQVVLRNELAWRTEAEVRRVCGPSGKRCASAFSVAVMPTGCCREACASFAGPRASTRGCSASARSPTSTSGCATVRRSGGGFRETLKWVSCFALAVNEENAAFGRVVTGPTNGAAGVVPAVLLYHELFGPTSPQAVEDFLLTAGEVGSLFKKGATLSAAMGGCQAEIGVSSAMAAAGLTQCLGGSPGQVLMAAEIAMEHHLGMTCDPVGGLVQVPCIERNTMGAIKAITACHLALESDPAAAKVSLDAVIRSMWQTAQDMDTKYKETAEGGLALQIPVRVIEC